MAEAAEHYRRLQRDLWLIRWSNEGRESDQEDALLDAMDVAWARLTEEERRLLDGEGPRCWPMDASSHVPSLEEVAHLLRPEQPTYEGFASAEEAIEDAAATGGR